MKIIRKEILNQTLTVCKLHANRSRVLLHQVASLSEFFFTPLPFRSIHSSFLYYNVFYAVNIQLVYTGKELIPFSVYLNQPKELSFLVFRTIVTVCTVKVTRSMIKLQTRMNTTTSTCKSIKTSIKEIQDTSLASEMK